MFQWVCHRTQNIGYHVHNNHQRADDHHARRDRGVVLLTNGVDEPAAEPRPAKDHFGNHRQR